MERAAATALLLLAATLAASCSGAATTPRPTTSPALPTPIDTPVPVATAPPTLLLPSESPGPGQAILAGQVVDAATGIPVAGARIRLDPFGVERSSDTDGRFLFRALSVPGRCRWVTLTVRKDGYGTLVTVDNPLFPARAAVTLFLERSDARHYIGPPLADASMGAAACAR